MQINIHKCLLTHTVVNRLPDWLLTGMQTHKYTEKNEFNYNAISRVGILINFNKLKNNIQKRIWN